MNYFSEELKKILSPSYKRVSYAGRTAYVNLGVDVCGKVEFITEEIADHYTAIKVTILNRKGGEVDHVVLKLADILGVQKFRGSAFRPFISENQGEIFWNVRSPLPLDYNLLGVQVCSYLEVFEEED